MNSPTRAQRSCLRPWDPHLCPHQHAHPAQGAPCTGSRVHCPRAPTAGHLSGAQVAGSAQEDRGIFPCLTNVWNFQTTKPDPRQEMLRTWTEREWQRFLVPLPPSPGARGGRPQGWEVGSGAEGLLCWGCLYLPAQGSRKPFSCVCRGTMLSGCLKAYPCPLHPRIPGRGPSKGPTRKQCCFTAHIHRDRCQVKT